MAKPNFTDQQKKAIELRNRNLLVSAAAGSGKTSVLVERIIRRVLDDKPSVDVDRLLIMTFTNAAAAQMREKILNAIDERRRSDPFDPNLRKQSALVHTASITTIHGFCLSILKNHFNEAGLSPDFRTADEGEAKLLRQDALSEVLEEAYKEHSEAFLNMAESVAVGRTDKALEQILDRLYEFSMSHPDHEAWLDSCVRSYEDFSTADDIEALPVVKEYLEALSSEVKEVEEGYLELKSFIQKKEGLSPYENTIDSDLSGVRAVSGASSLRAFSEALKEMDFIRFGQGGKKSTVKAAEEDKAFLKERRDFLKGRMSKLKEQFAVFSLEGEKEKAGRCLAVIKELVRLAKKYIERYSEKKRDAGIIDYADMEHLAIKVLSENDDTIGREYREHYEEVYVDEYQDTNFVQEALLKAVTRGRNLFMVGDVKQSIYGFRLARPDIFIEKYNNYSKEESENQRIDLTSNFRSGREIINTVNELFSVTMNARNSGFDYDEDAKLRFGASAPSGDGDETRNRTELIITEREDSGADPKETEAKAVALRIAELIRNHKTYDSDSKEFRPVRYGDIVILLRTLSG